ncbi:hypothetical protein RvVAR0630_pl06000 (plasmid) [Agrobacterium vitis]|nr:hypothetical protein RvVAR0630_pl06000 [Agrobacterium vitis]
MHVTDGEFYAEMERRAAALPEKAEKWSFKLIRIAAERKRTVARRKKAVT